MTGRRGLLLAVALAGIGGAVAALSATQPWASGMVRSAVTTTPVAVTGGSAAPVSTAAGLLGLAAVGALPATRRLGRVLVGLLLVTAAGAAISAAIAFLTDPRSARFRTVELPDGGPTVATTALPSTVAVSAWPWLSCIAGLALLLAGLLAVVTGHRWPVLGRRYEAPAGSPAAAPAVQRGPAGLWDELDAGRDPTAAERPDPLSTDPAPVDRTPPEPAPADSGGADVDARRR